VCKAAIKRAELFDPDAPCIRIYHQNLLDQFVGRGEHIGFPFFELDTFNRVERHHLSNCDRLFVTSEWGKEVVHNNIGTDTPVHVIPLGVDLDVFQPSPPEKSDKTIFFNCGKWEVRKGHDILITAFKQAFDVGDNVELWMMCDNPFNTPEENQKWLTLYDHPNVRIINRVQTHKDVYNIMSQVTCGVFPSRGEGWNMEALEMMACGKQMIITDYSAHTQFCTHQNSHLVGTSGLELAMDNKWFFGQGSWASLSGDNIATISEHMKSIHQHKQSGTGMINHEAIKTAHSLSWDNAALEIKKVLDNV